MKGPAAVAAVVGVISLIIVLTVDLWNMASEGTEDRILGTWALWVLIPTVVIVVIASEVDARQQQKGRDS